MKYWPLSLPSVLETDANLSCYLLSHPAKEAQMFPFQRRTYCCFKCAQNSPIKCCAVKREAMAEAFMREKKHCFEIKIFGLKKDLNWDSSGNLSSCYHRNWADVLSRIQNAHSAVKCMTLWISSNMLALLLLLQGNEIILSCLYCIHKFIQKSKYNKIIEPYGLFNKL